MAWRNTHASKATHTRAPRNCTRFLSVGPTGALQTARLKAHRTPQPQIGQAQHSSRPATARKILSRWRPYSRQATYRHERPETRGPSPNAPRRAPPNPRRPPAPLNHRDAKGTRTHSTEHRTVHADRFRHERRNRASSPPRSARWASGKALEHHSFLRPHDETPIHRATHGHSPQAREKAASILFSASRVVLRDRPLERCRSHARQDRRHRMQHQHRQGTHAHRKKKTHRTTPWQVARLETQTRTPRARNNQRGR